METVEQEPPSTPQDPATWRHVLLRLSGDITTKSRRTRVSFVRRLKNNILDALDSAGIEHTLEGGWTRLYVETPRAEAMSVLPRVFGIQSLSVARRLEWQDLEDLVEKGEELFATRVQGKSFAVRARRGGDRRRIPFRSQDIERQLGTALLAHARKVDLDHPEITVNVELDGAVAYFFTEHVAAHGGLPVGTEGRALALVSGGFDSAVAAWQMLKRGVRLDYLFYNLGGAVHEEGTLEVMKVLARDWSYGYRPRLYAADLRPSTEELRSVARPHNWQVLLKRLMFRGAERVARHNGSVALVTGEAVGQVSSQTLPNLAVVSQATDLPILRPLLGFNKEEIVALARHIGTFAASAKVAEYCALEARPTTQASAGQILKDEAGLDPGKLDRSVAEARVYALRAQDVPRESSPDLSIDHVPDHATVLDLRSETAFRAWHYPGALRLDYARALAQAPSFDPSRTYVISCEVEFKSTHLAEHMRHAGLTAYHFQGGTKGLLAHATQRGLTDASLIAPAVREE